MTGTWYTDQEAHAVFREANEAHARGELDAAAEGYRKLLEHGAAGPDVHYNLGTTALAQGRLGSAVLHLEAARRESPAADDIAANLALARSRQLDRVVGAPHPGSITERLAHVTPLEQTGVAFLIIWGMGFLLLAARRLAPQRLRLALAVGAALSLVVAVPLGLLVANRAWVDANVREGVVMVKAAPVRAFPSESGSVEFEVHEGLEVRLLEQSGGYVRIRLPNGREGWTPADGVTSRNWTTGGGSPTRGSARHGSSSET